MKTTLCSLVASIAVIFTGCVSTPKSAHERRLKQAEYEHLERLEQIRHAAEEAKEVKAAGDAGVQIAHPSSAADQTQPTVVPTRQWSGRAGQSPLGGGQPTWVDGAGVRRLRPNRSVGSGGVGIRRPQPVWVDSAGVSRLAPARSNR